MIEQIKVHFDELLLAILFVAIVAVWCFNPDDTPKEWAGGLLAALIMALRNKYSPSPGETKTNTEIVSNTTEETKEWIYPTIKLAVAILLALAARNIGIWTGIIK